MKKIFTILAFHFFLINAVAQQGVYPAELWSNLDKVVGNAKVVAFGESSHRLEELHKFANDMFQYLVEKKGFRVFVFESMWELENAVNDYIASDSAEMTRNQQIYLNAFNSVYTRNMVKWVKSWNKKNPADPITISGYHPQQPVSDSRDIKKYFAQASVNIPDSILSILNVFPFFNGTHKTDIETLSYFGKKRRAKEPYFRRSERDSIRNAMDALMLFAETNQTKLSATLGADLFTELKLHIESLKFYLLSYAYYVDGTNYTVQQPLGDSIKTIELRERNIYSEVDNMRAHIFNTLRQTRFKDKKIFIWMHAWHAAKQSFLSGTNNYFETPPFGTVSIGTYLAPKLGKDYVVVGSVVSCTKCNYQVPAGEVDIADAFYKKFGERRVLFSIKNENKLMQGLPLNTPVSMFVHEGACFVKNINFSQQFDAVIYLPQSANVK